MKNKLTDRPTKKKTIYNSSSLDNGTKDGIIELVDAIEEDEVIREANAENIALDRLSSGDTAKFTEDTDSKPVREETAEWDVFSRLSLFFDSCDGEVSKLIGEAEETGKEKQVHSDGVNILKHKPLANLNAENAVDSKNHVTEETAQEADELSEELFDDLEMNLEAIGEDCAQDDNMSEAKNDLPEEFFDDLMTGSVAATENSAVDKTINLEGRLAEHLFINLERVWKAPATEPNELEAVHPQGGSTPKPHKEDLLDTGKYFLELRGVDKKIAVYQRKIEQLMDKKEKMKKQYEHLSDILGKKGEELKKAVSVVLKEYWSLEISYMDKEKRDSFNENIIIQLDGRNILTKIKSTDKRKLPNKFITQVWQDLYFSNLGPTAEGALIVNYDLRSSEQYSASEHIAIDKELLADIIFIDTRILHELTIAILSSDLSIHEAKKILFKKE
jgi:hypothetical protein